MKIACWIGAAAVAITSLGQQPERTDTSIVRKLRTAVTILAITMRPPVQKELNLSKDQKKQLEASLKTLKTDFTAAPKDDSTAHIIIVGKTATALIKSLNPQQLQRAKELALQFRGPEALIGDPDVRAKVGVTPEQQIQMESAVEANWSQFRSVEGELAKTNDKASIEAIEREATTRINAAILGVLTPDQAQKFADLQGKPFDFTNAGITTESISDPQPPPPSPEPPQPGSVADSALSTVALGTNPKVAKELGLSKDQQAKLKGIFNKFVVDAGTKGLNNPEAMLALKTTAAQEAIGGLKGKQLDRLQQLALQYQGGPKALLLNMGLRQALKLSPQQQQQVGELMEKYGGALQSLKNVKQGAMETLIGGITKSLGIDLKSGGLDIGKMVLGILNPGQKLNMIKLVGKLFNF